MLIRELIARRTGGYFEGDVRILLIENFGRGVRGELTYEINKLLA